MIQYSVIIPAYNEEELLPGTFQALKAAMATVAMDGEVIVVDNNSTDKTAEIARKFEARVIFEKINQISRARNVGAMHARGNYLLFLDADTMITPDLLQTALNNLKNKQLSGGGSTVIPDKKIKPFYQRGMDIWNWFSVRSQIAAGSFIYCLRDGFEAVGGFSQKVYAGEEHPQRGEVEQHVLPPSLSPDRASSFRFFFFATRLRSQAATETLSCMRSTRTPLRMRANNSPLSIGFRRKSSAPASSAWIMSEDPQRTERKRM